MVEIEIKPLMTEIQQIDYNCLDYSNRPSPQNDFNPASSPEDRKNANETESNDTVKKNIGGTQHKCLVCGKCFKKRWIFADHMRTHSDERPFECSLCHRK